MRMRWLGSACVMTAKMNSEFSEGEAPAEPSSRSRIRLGRSVALPFLKSATALIGVLLLIGCAERQQMDCPDRLAVDTSHMDHAVRAKYSAQQVKDRIIIRATGELPAGYEAVFVQSPQQVYPPQLSLMRHRLHGEYRAMQKEFSSCVAFKATDAVDHVTVSDAAGPNEVSVTSSR
jgi:hypothetical protein